MKTKILTLVSLFTLLSFMAFAQKVEPNDASKFTVEFNKKVAIPTSTEDFDDIKRGLVAKFDIPEIKNDEGKLIWDFATYQFLTGNAPETVNPSLWRQGILTSYAGLFKVTDNIYQIRGADVSNMTIIEGSKGIIVIDPLISAECAKVALELYYKHRPKTPIKAVIYTHSHVDHYGGVKGIISEKDVKSGKIKIYAPEGFLDHAISENVYAGNAMSRRAMYSYGELLPFGPKGEVTNGLGIKTSTGGTVTLIPPTVIIKKDGEKHKIDGVEVVFMMAKNTEAPSEMFFYFPKFKALCAAEVSTHTMHNLYTLRGAQVRDSKAWWKALNKMENDFAAKSDVIFASHHWPVWGSEKISKFLLKQRDLYKYMHDQTLHLMNQGYTGVEIAEMVKMPDSLYTEGYNRGYYGSLSHNIRAIYQYYLGWFDGNPTNLNRYPPVEESKKYIAAVGGIQNAIDIGQKAIDSGDYRWASTILYNAVFADPDNKKAKDLLASAYEQLAYQAENALWRNFYLEGAFELRNGLIKDKVQSVASPDTLSAMDMDMVFDFMGIQLDTEKAKGKVINLNWEFKDLKKKYATTLENSVFVYTEGKVLDKADASIVTNKSVIDDVNSKKITMKDAIDKGLITITGDKGKLTELLSMMVEFELLFNIVTP